MGQGRLNHVRLRRDAVHIGREPQLCHRYRVPGMPVHGATRPTHVGDHLSGSQDVSALQRAGRRARRRGRTAEDEPVQTESDRDGWTNLHMVAGELHAVAATFF